MQRRSLIGAVLFCVVLFSAAPQDWDLALLDTARDVDYLTRAEKDVILELNMVRSDPRKYADLYIKPRIAYFNGNLFSEPGRSIGLMTNEGATAVEECYQALINMQPVPLLYPEQGLSLAAKDHVLDTGKTGRVGHTSSDGSTMGGRLNRYGKWAGSAGENISYGNDRARDIVVQLLIDDGVSSRRHRTNNMSEVFTCIGVAVGKHAGYGSMCVLDFAGTYTGN
ncbi:MAG: CAP domain-containing protein [Treponema sp.]|nr:CAP domain-containing protein [Treponema sp.]